MKVCLITYCMMRTNYRYLFLLMKRAGYNYHRFHWITSKIQFYEIEVGAWTEDDENVIHSFIVEVLDIYEAPFDFNATSFKRR